jgi:hypothetical protein
MNEWISVNHSLPGINNLVEFCFIHTKKSCKGKIMRGEVNIENLLFACTPEGDHLSLKNITRWRYLPENISETCGWQETRHPDNFSLEPYYETECGNSYQQHTELTFKFCPFCGNTIEEVKE